MTKRPQTRHDIELEWLRVQEEAAKAILWCLGVLAVGGLVALVSLTLWG